jgi:alpha-N-arabinofuranosidase
VTLAANSRLGGGTILTAPAMDSHNDFGKPPAVAPATFSDMAIIGGRLTVNMPAKSIVVVAIEQ